MRQWFPRWITLLLVLSVPTGAFGAGFLIFEAGGKALGSGGAFTARADDPSAIFYNPAGIATLEGVQLYGGVSLIFTGSEFAGVDPEPGYGVKEETESLLFTPINVYATWQFKPNLAAGLGIYNPYGLGRDWKNETVFTGRHIAHEVDLKSFYFNPTIAWQPNEYVAGGLGIQLVYSSVDLKRYLEQWDPNGTGWLNVGTLELDGDNTMDFGWNVGILVHPNEKWRLGLTYRSSVKVEYEGDADFTQIPTGNTALDTAVATVFPQSQGATTQIEFPWLASFGVAFTGLERWVFEIDLNWTGWETFDALPFEFQSDPSLNQNRPQNFENKLSIRTGLAYDLTEIIELRGGYYYDPSPQPQEGLSPLLSDSDRHGLTFGGGYTPGPWVFDIYALFVFFDERTTGGNSSDGYDGNYASYANIFGLNVGYRF